MMRRLSVSSVGLAVVKMINPVALRLAIVVLVAGASAPVLAQSSFTFQAPTGPGGTWNIYRLESGGLTFKAANNAANATFDPVAGTVAGRLVSIWCARSPVSP
jgi:hypothetical protein